MPPVTPLALEDLEGPDKGIWDLVRTNPTQADFIREGAGHARGLKNVTLNTWPNITGFVQSSHAEIDGATAFVAGGARYVPPVGSVLQFFGLAAALPTNWLLCDGAALVQATYPELFAILGTRFGGDATNFNLPDLRGRVLAGADDMGGAAAGRLTGYTEFFAGGAQTHKLTEAQMPAHFHSMTYPAGTTGSGPGQRVAGTGAGVNTTTVGGNQAHANVQPTLACNMIICAIEAPPPP